MNPTTNELVFGVVAAYFVILMIIGWKFSHGTTTSAEYYKGGNVIPWWAAGLSQYMASHSAYSFVVMAGVIYSRGMFGLLWTLSAPFMILLGAITLASRWRRTGLTTPVQYLVQRFSPRFRETFAWLSLISRPLGNGIRMAAFGILVTAMLGRDRQTPVAGWLTMPDLVVLAGMTVTAGYTLLGGLFGAVAADVLQFVILQAALIPLFIFSLGKVGGWSGLLAAAPAGFFRLPALSSVDWLWFAGWGIIFFCDFNAAQWGLVTRYLGTRSEPDARKAGILAACLYLPLILLAMTPILAARALNPAVHPESSFGWMARTVLPGGLVALMVAAMFSATLATISAELNSLAGIFAIDIYRGRLFPNATDARVVQVGRWATVVSAAATIVVGLLVSHGAGTVLSAAQQVASYFVIPMAVPILLGLFTWRQSSRSAFASMGAGAIAAWASYALCQHWGLSSGATTFWQNAGTGLVSVVVYFGSRWLFPSKAGETGRAQNFIRSLASPAPPREGEDAGFPAPLRVVGWSIVATGAILLCTLLQPETREHWIALAATDAGLLATGCISLWSQGKRKVA